MAPFWKGILGGARGDKFPSRGRFIKRPRHSEFDSYSVGLPGVDVGIDIYRYPSQDTDEGSTTHSYLIYDRRLFWRLICIRAFYGRYTGV